MVFGCQDFALSSCFNFHGWWHRQSKIRPFEINWSIRIVYPEGVARPLSLVRDKSNYLLLNGKKKPQESYVPCNDHLPVMKTLRQWVHVFLFLKQPVVSEVRYGKERLPIFICGVFVSTITTAQIQRVSFMICTCSCCSLELNLYGHISLFLLLVAFIVHPRCWHCQIATAGWLFHHTHVNTNLYCFPASQLLCISQKECEQSFHSEKREGKKKKRKWVGPPQSVSKEGNF